MPGYSQEELTRLEKAFGYTYEDVKNTILPMARTGAEPTAAMGMAITADKLGAQPSELSFRAIRAIELPENLGGLKPEEAAELVSKCATENGFTLDTVTIKSIKAC